MPLYPKENGAGYESPDYHRGGRFPFLVFDAAFCGNERASNNFGDSGRGCAGFSQILETVCNRAGSGSARNGRLAHTARVDSSLGSREITRDFLLLTR